MASTRNDDVYDMEEEFARELAAVAADSLSDSDDYSGPGYADWNNKEDDNSEGRWGGDNGGEQLASLVALKQRLAEEDGKLKVFSEILQELQLQPEWTAPGLSNEALPQTRTVGEKGMGHPKEQSEEEERVIQPGSSAQAEHRRPASVSSQGSVRLRATEESERFKAWREFEAAERQRSSAREAARRQAEAQAEEERRQLEEEAARRAAELEASTARRVAELEAAAAEEEARARREIEAEAKEEARAREAEAEAAAAAALAAEERNRQAAMREAAREEKARIVLERQLDIARRAVAAHRIWRRWRSYHGSSRRRRRLEAIISIQSIARGRAGRAKAEAARKRRDAATAMEAARAAGNLEALQAAAEAAKALGLGNEAQRELTAFEEASRAASGTLLRASQVGDAESFFAALSAAEKFCRLGGLLGEARAAFHQRQSNALRRLERSAMDGGEPMTRLQDHAAAATALGADPGAITAALAAAKVRDAEAEKRLVAAVGADPFDPSELRKRLEAVELLGLLPQASEARKRLRARQVAAAEVLQAASVAGSAAEVAEASARALSLGLADSVGLAEAELSRRRRAAAAELVRAAKLGKAEEYEVAAGEAARLGVEMAARAEACEGFGGRRAAALEALRAAATEGTLEEFASASKVALNLGASDDVNKASKAVAARRWEALRSLKNVTRAMLGRKLPAAPQDMASCRLLEVPTAQCPLGASCSGASEPSPANREAWMQLESWADLLASETCPEDLKSPVSEVLRICDGMGLGPWVRAAWAVVRAASAAAHAAGRGSVAVLQMPVDYWGNAHGPAELQTGKEVEALGDPVASLAMSWKTALPLVSPRPALLWPQQHPPGIPCIETSIVEEEQDMPGAEEPCRDEDAGSPSREGGIGTALTAKMLRANSPGAPLESLEALDLSLEGLGSLAGLPELCPRLTRLSAAANRFRGNALADLVGCFDLQEVLLRENSITGVRGASSLPSLRCLHVDANKISSAEGLEGCSQLQDLSLADNQLVDISATNLAACSRLERLCLSGNRLRVLRSSTLAPLAALQHLDVTGNRLVGLAGLEACPHLLTLKIGSNQLRALPAMGCCQLLRELHAPENHLTVLPKLAWMPHLTVLDVHDNRIASLPALDGLPRLKHLDLSFNRLSDPGQLMGVLSGAISLVALQVSDNPAASADRFIQKLVGRLPWIQELNHDAVDAPRVVEEAAKSLASSPAAAPALVRAQLHANRPVFGITRPGAAVHAQETLRAMGPRRLQALAASLAPGAHGTGSSAGSPSTLAAAEERWRRCTIVNLAAQQAASLPSSRPWDNRVPEVGPTHEVRDLLAKNLRELSAEHRHQAVFEPRPEYAERIEAAKARAATALQARWRGVIAARLRRRLAAERDDAHLNASASLVQAVWRGRAYRHSEDLRNRRAELGRRRQRQAEEEARRRELAAIVLQACARGWSVRRRIAQLRDAAKYSDDGFDFDEEVNLDFIRPPEGMELSDSDEKVLDGPGALAWEKKTAAFVPPPGPLATTVSPAMYKERPAALVVEQERLQGGTAPSYDYSAALEKRRLSSSGGALVPSLQRSAETRACIEAVNPSDLGLPSPTKSVAESSSALSYGSSMTDGERRAKLRAKVEKVAGEWGFENPGTAEAFYRAQQKKLRAQKKKKHDQKYSDPQVRWQRLKSQVEARPQLHTQRDTQPRGKTLQPQKGVVQGPPSQQSNRKPPPAWLSPGRQEEQPPDQGVPPPLPRRRPHSETSTGVEDSSINLPPLPLSNSKAARPGSAGVGGPTTLEFRTGPPNGKLARRALTDPALSPGSRVAKEYRYIPAPPAPAWDGPSGGIENGIAGYAFVGPSNMASSKKPRIPAEARQHRIGMMQVLSPQQRL